MRILLDTHALLWAADKPANLSAAAAAEILNTANERLLSAAVFWELSIKVGLGKIVLSLPYYHGTKESHRPDRSS